MSRPPKKSRVASLHDEAYARFVLMLVDKRKASGLSQQEVADALGWNQSIISKIEKKQRRIEIIELLRVAQVEGFDAVRMVREARSIMIEMGELT